MYTLHIVVAVKISPITGYGPMMSSIWTTLRKVIGIIPATPAVDDTPPQQEPTHTPPVVPPADTDAPEVPPPPTPPTPQRLCPSRHRTSATVASAFTHYIRYSSTAYTAALSTHQQTDGTAAVVAGNTLATWHPTTGVTTTTSSEKATMTMMIVMVTTATGVASAAKIPRMTQVTIIGKAAVALTPTTTVGCRHTC